jgi:hypothetical protein
VNFAVRTLHRNLLLAKVGVVGSNPIARSSSPHGKKPRGCAAFVVSAPCESWRDEEPEAGAVAARLHGEDAAGENAE